MNVLIRTVIQSTNHKDYLENSWKMKSFTTIESIHPEYCGKRISVVTLFITNQEVIQITK